VKRILLVCSAGMSTSLLVSKMRIAALEQGIEAEIHAVAEAELSNHSDKADVVLLGPQVRFLLSKMKASLEPKGISVAVINSVDYGTMNGENVLKQAIELIG
jgi:PTS system cellobiose-specific IIB component